MLPRLPVHSIAVIVRPGNLVGRSHAKKARKAALHGAIEAFLPCGREEEKVCSFDEFAVDVVERAVHAMLFETGGNTVLQLSMSFVIHAHRDLPVLYLNGLVK
jgi:hypothetical protein